MYCGYTSIKRRHIREQMYSCLMRDAEKIKPVHPVAKSNKLTREQFHKLFKKEMKA